MKTEGFPDRLQHALEEGFSQGQVDAARLNWCRFGFCAETELQGCDLRNFRCEVFGDDGSDPEGLGSRSFCETSMFLLRVTTACSKNGRPENEGREKPWKSASRPSCMAGSPGMIIRPLKA